MVNQLHPEFDLQTCASVSALAPSRSRPAPAVSGWLVPSTTYESPLKPMRPLAHPSLQRLALDQQLREPFMRRSLILAASLAFLGPFAAAQHHGTMSMNSMAPRSAAPIVSRHMAAAGPVHMSSPARVGTRIVTTRTRAGGTTVRVIRPANSAIRRRADNNSSTEDQGFSQDFSTAPGLGFDETHVVATRGRRFGDHGRNRFDSGFFPFFDGGFIVPTPVGVDQAPPNEVQEETVAPDTQERVQRVRPPESAAASSAVVALAPRRETEEYVFVRRDGTVFFAVAYSWDNGLLRYITQDGLRRSISGDVLDLGATQQFNDQLGLNFHAPA
jgi:hypothetical protein